MLHTRLMSDPSPAHCRRIVPLLRARDGQKTTVELSGSRSFEVFDIAWGEDIGDDYEHITTNCSPGVGGADIDLFFTDEVMRIVAPENGEVLWAADGTPSVR